MESTLVSDDSNIKNNIKDKRATKLNFLGKVLNSSGIYAIAILFLLLGILLQSLGIINSFLTATNFLNILDAVTLLGIVAVGMGFVTFSGHYADMSVPTTMAFTGIICVQMLQFGFIPALIITFLFGAVIGLINAIAIGKYKANPIIWTLSINFVTMGIIRLVWANKQIYPDFVANTQRTSDLFDNIYRYRFFGKISLPLVLLIILVILLNFVMKKTKYGAQLKMTGAAKKAAGFSGIKTEFIIGMAFMICALTATLGGIVLTSLTRVGYINNGVGFDFQAVTAIVIGGMTLAGGRGTVIGVIGGVLVMGLMNNILTLLGVGTFSQDIIRGTIFILVVGLNAKSLRSMGRDDA